MQLQEFRTSLEHETPPQVDPMLVALWHDGKGDWEKAHHIVQESNTPMACWIHAYLHRKEGDLGNAGYWYNRAGKSTPEIDLETEWEQLVLELINS